ncbi:MAG: type II toxin-antitoxin system RelE/ParE family toxin [Saprospiraceae bacterium]|nr:type II toxin-antitoxin system RelE/ParE family toxin [Saprospiraceae bacterium]
MESKNQGKEIYWVGTSLHDLKDFPKVIKQKFGFHLYQIQQGYLPNFIKPLKGSGLNGVIELKENYIGNTYRSVLIAKLRNKIYVLHCFQKKSNQGLKTPLNEINIIKQRLKIAVNHANNQK